jgi:hypothetical protein
LIKKNTQPIELESQATDKDFDFDQSEAGDQSAPPLKPSLKKQTSQKKMTEGQFKQLV